MSKELYMSLVVCFLIGMLPLILTYLNTDATRTKWIWTGIWTTFWWIPPLFQLYRFALSG